jgi:pimeloyl-ACP methyl ester carboxylesterase
VSLPGRFVTTSAGRVFVHRAGAPTGHPPLVLLHGLMMSHYIFRGLLPALTAEHEVIAVDLPGFGESDRPPPQGYAYDAPAFATTVVEVLDALSIGRASLLGHSMGGGVGLTLAARWPARVARVCLASATVYPLPQPPEAKLLFNEFLGPLVWHHVMARRDFARVERARHVRDPRVITDEHVDYYWARLNRAGGREAAYAALTQLARLQGASADPGRVRAPTLLVWAEEDRVVPLAHGKRLARALPGAELRVVPACGHDLFLERPDEFLRQVQPFLRVGRADGASQSAHGSSP